MTLNASNPAPLRIAVCIKQIPAFAEMTLDGNGRLQRDGLALEMNPYCRRAVAQGALLAHASGGHVTVFTMGPPRAEDVLREALAWCDSAGAAARALLISDPAFAGSDTLATARTLHAALDREGPFDLVLLGRNSVDADTGQVGPELAELLGVPFVTAARTLKIGNGVAEARSETDDGSIGIQAAMPTVISCAERLCDPAKVDPDGRAAVDADRITAVRADDLGAGPWGAAGSPTWVGETRRMATTRRGVLEPEASLDEQIAGALETLAALGAFDAHPSDGEDVTVPMCTGGAARLAVLLEPGEPDAARELLGAAAGLAGPLAARVVAVVCEPVDHNFGSWGADEILQCSGTRMPADLAHGLTDWCSHTMPSVVLAPATTWGRETAARLAARLGAGLTGDAVELSVEDGRLVAWKPAFGGEVLAAIHSRSAIQMATVRPGVLPLARPRDTTADTTVMVVPSRGGLRPMLPTRDDDVRVLATAPVVVGVGQGVAPDAYPALDPLLHTLGAQLAATRKVTDQGWMPRSRQVGITGRSISPRLYVAIGTSGKFNHMAGVRGARSVLAINTDPTAPVFGYADAGIVADWHDAVPALVAALSRQFLRD